MSGRARRPAERALVVLASVVLVLALLAGYAWRTVVDSDQFANRATAALRADSVRALVAQRITDEVVLRRRADLLTARPLIQSATAELVGGRAFTALFRLAVRDLHRAAFDRDQRTVTLTVADVGTVLAAALQTVRPALARRVEGEPRVVLLKRDLGSAGSDLAQLGRRVRLLAWLLAVLWVALVAAALAVSRDRRRTVTGLGIGAAAGGVALVVALVVARQLAVGGVAEPDARAAAGAVWGAFFDDLRTAAWILAGAGAVVAAAAASVLRPVGLQEPLRRAGAWLLTEPVQPLARALRAAVLVGAGIALLVDREAVIALVAGAAGVFLIFAGMASVLRLVHRPEAAERVPARPERPPRRWRTLAVAGLALALVAAAIGAFVGTGGASEPPPPAAGCNGHAALCDRPLDEVALAATHNSMSVPLPGWFAALQERPIGDQLRDGIHGLLIDTYYADRLPNGNLRTDLTGKAPPGAGEDGVSPQAVAAARRLRARAGFGGQGVRGMYLCHTFCELGATPLADALDELRDLLVLNPGEVVVVINQDSVTPEDFVRAVDAAGLGELVYRGPTGARWATLGEMVERNQRVVFLAENRAGGAPWYHLAYERITQETPYAFGRAAQLVDPAQLPASCREYRGPPDAPLFLVNHWVTTDPVPRPSDAAKVNAREPLLRRMRTCAKLRGRMPNLVAVNFYREGDVFGVVDTLNGVGPGH